MLGTFFRNEITQIAQQSGDYQFTYDEILYTFSFMRVK
jgi:hypothetical protein